MRSLSVALALALFLVAPTASVAAQPDGCSPTSAGPNSAVYFQRVKDSCPADSFIRAEDVPQWTVDNGGPLPDDQYVLAASITRDDGLQLLTLVKPWSLANFTVAVAVTRVALDRGFDDGHAWNWTNPPADASN